MRLAVYTPIVYTGVVLVEEVPGRTHAIVPAMAVNGESRWKLFGKTASGRYLVVVFTIRENLFRAVTAYPMSATDRRNYAPQIR
jgi:uncharacterized DUF497 family protein